MKQSPQMKTLAGNQSSPNNLITARAETAHSPKKVTAMTNLPPESLKPNPKVTLSAVIGDEGRKVTFNGRDAWALDRLVSAGSGGCTPIDEPAPRWSGYVHNLRRAGVDIETVYETHRGPFPGNHARYVLRSPVSIVEASGGISL